MSLEGLICALKEMEIETDGVEEGSRLGADLGMDSQEIVDLRARLNARFGIALPERSLKKASTVADVLALVESLRESEAPPARRGACSAKAVIEASAAEAYRALFELSRWTRHLPHVLAVEVAYDDGRYQEFFMTVEAKTGTLRVRSIRRCDGGESIEFFQPEPPPFLVEHSGGWRFRPLTATTCEVETYHRWTAHPAKASVTYGGTPEEQDAKIHAQLLEHAELALRCWKVALESGAVRRARALDADADTAPAPASRRGHAALPL